MFFRRKVPKWECPRGYQVGRPIFYGGWLEDRAIGPSLVKEGVHNPMLPNSGRKKFDWSFCFGGVITITVCAAVIFVGIGQLFDDDPWAAFRDIADLAHKVF